RYLVRHCFLAFWRFFPGSINTSLCTLILGHRLGPAQRTPFSLVYRLNDHAEGRALIRTQAMSQNQRAQAGVDRAEERPQERPEAVRHEFHHRGPMNEAPAQTHLAAEPEAEPGLGELAGKIGSNI